MDTTSRLLFAGLLFWLAGGGLIATGFWQARRAVVPTWNIAVLLQGTINQPIDLKPSEVVVPTFTDDVVTVYMDGSVKFGTGFNGDSAARVFWEKIGEKAPDIVRPLAEIPRGDR